MATLDATEPGHARRSAARVVGIVAVLGVFLVVFDHERNQPLVDLLFVGAIALWVWEVRSRNRGPLLSVQPTRADAWLLGSLLVVFAACWLPFYGNWRWAFTGDSISFFGSGYYLYQRGLKQNLLSTHGIDGFYTYLWEVTYNLGVFVFGPTLFGHRFGLFVMACLALASTYAFYAAVWGRWWSTAVVIATATNYVWIFFSYVSYLRMDGIAFYNAVLLLGTTIWRHPDVLGPYLVLGLTAGLSLFFTPAVWSCVAVVSALILLRALLTGRTAAAIVLLVSAALVAVPVLRELPWFVEMLQKQSVAHGRSALPDAAYVWRILTQIVWSPVSSPIDRLGGQGAFFCEPLRQLYVAGLGLGGLALVPALRRRLRLPDAAGALLALLMWDALFLALTNKGYGNFSHKRSYVLLPLQVFFGILPLYAVWAWTKNVATMRRGMTGLVILVLAVYAAANIRLLENPPAGSYGSNAYDGLIELRQRFAPRPVFLLTSREMIVTALQPKELFHLAYGVLDYLTVSQDFSPATVDAACKRQALICYEPNPDRDRMQVLLAHLGDRVRRFPILNSHELVCVECVRVAANLAPTG